MPTDRYDTPKTPVALDVTDLSNFAYDMSRCIKCKGCYWVEHTYMPGVRFSTRCPANVWNDFDAYGAFGKCRIGLAILDGKLQWTPKLLESSMPIPYAAPATWAAKEPRPRDRADPGGPEGKGGQGRRGPHACTQEGGGEPGEAAQPVRPARREQEKWITKDIKVAEKAEVMYFAAAPHPTSPTRSPRRRRRY